MFFVPESMKGGVIKPRPYQIEAFESLDQYLATKAQNPCVVIPTGGGKSIMIAWAIMEWVRDYPAFRVCIVAHRKELIEQNSAELISLWPAGDIGLYAAALRKRNTEAAITFATIDTIYNKWGHFAPFDMIIVDEAHRIPPKGEGKYRTFIKGCKSINPNLRIVGFTATPFRMGCGPICHRDHILNEICYSANVGDLIANGFLSKLRSKIGDVQADLSNVERTKGGDYKEGSLARAVDTPVIVQGAVRSAMQIIKAENRKSSIFFCVDENHCKDVNFELRKYGVEAPIVTAKTPLAQRERFAKAFVDGAISALININVYTEGFNAKRTDHVVLLRPTLSAALYHQMVGRGLRLFPGKEDCIVSDFAHCIDEHGPIDCPDIGSVKVEVCAKCGDAFSRAVRICPHCGWEIPKELIEKREAEEKEKKMHDIKASNRNILSSVPEDLTVDDVDLFRHRKVGQPDSIRIQYRCGVLTVNEWIGFEHEGFFAMKSRRWWANRFGTEAAKKITNEEVFGDMFLAQEIKNLTESITVKQNGKYKEIIGYKLRTRGVQ
jgi:DNA repair protein RadD